MIEYPSKTEENPKAVTNYDPSEIEPHEEKSIGIKEAMNMPRHERRRLAKLNGIKKIPSIANLPKPKESEKIQAVKRSDNYFNNIFNKSK